MFINEWHDAGTTELHDVAEEFLFDCEEEGNEGKIVSERTHRGYKYFLFIKFAC